MQVDIQKEMVVLHTRNGVQPLYLEEIVEKDDVIEVVYSKLIDGGQVATYTEGVKPLGMDGMQRVWSKDTESLVWGGKTVLGVYITLNASVVYVVLKGVMGVEIIGINDFNAEEVVELQNELDKVNSFYLKVEERVLLDYIGGVEGLRGLRAGLELVLNTGGLGIRRKVVDFFVW